MLDRRAACVIVVLTWSVDGAMRSTERLGRRSRRRRPFSPLRPKAQRHPKRLSTTIPPTSANWRARVAAARQRHADWGACVAAKGRNCSEAPVPDPMEPLLNDDTLVNGDIVSTPNGFKVFRGQATIPHSLADFQ